MPDDANERSTDLTDRLQVAISDVRARNGRVRRGLGRALDDSLLGTGVHGLDRALEYARLAAWFRRPPDSPVSIDVADANVAGPLVALLGPPLRCVATAWRASTAARALRSLRRPGSPNPTGVVRSITLGPTRVASAIVLVALLALLSVRGLPADSIVIASVALGVGAALLGVIAGPRARFRTSALGQVLRWLRGEAPEASDRSR